MKKFLVILAVGIALTSCAPEENEVTGGQGPAVRDIIGDKRDDTSGARPHPPRDESPNPTLPPNEPPTSPPTAPDPSPTPNPSPEPPPANPNPRPQAVGFYSDGHLINDYYFPLEGPGILKVFRGRKRHHSTWHLFRVIASGAQSIQESFKGGERLQVGDIAKFSGGQLSLHLSHQNGLDADIAYFRVNRREMSPEGFGGFDEIFVRNGQVTTNFDVERNFSFMKALVNTKQVGRIFVDAAIKAKFCGLSTGQKLSSLDEETLRRMRPLQHHGDHLHLRIKCPLSSLDCITQVEPPEGTGCPRPGEVLVNSFSSVSE